MERISADQDPAIKKYVFDGCTGARVKALLGRKICIQMSYPDVYQSNDHPYTPLTGDVDFRFYVVPNDMWVFNFHFYFHFILLSIVSKGNCVMFDSHHEIPDDPKRI